MIWLKVNGPGIGDAVFLTAVAHELKKTGMRVGCVSHHNELYHNNPDIDNYATDCPESIDFPELHQQHLIQEHNVQFMCRKLGLVPPRWEEIRQYIYLKAEEQINYSSPYITIHAGTGNWTPNKQWHQFDKFSFYD